MATTSGADTATVTPAAANRSRESANTPSSRSVVGTTNPTPCSAHTSIIRSTNPGWSTRDKQPVID